MDDRRAQNQGRCHSCGVLHIWNKTAGPKVYDAKCPACGYMISRTTREVEYRLPTHRWAGFLGAGVATITTATEARALQQARLNAWKVAG